MHDGRIEKLCENVYLVCGKLIGFDAPGMFDMDDPGIRKDFAAFADDLYAEGSEIPDRRYGDETICIFRPIGREGGFTCVACHVDDLKDGIRDAVRKAMAARTERSVS